MRLIKDLEKQMKAAAQALEFEKAATLRDEIIELRRAAAGAGSKTGLGAVARNAQFRLGNVAHPWLTPPIAAVFWRRFELVLSSLTWLLAPEGRPTP